MKRNIILLSILTLLNLFTKAQTNDSTYLNYLNNSTSIPKMKSIGTDMKNIIKTDIFSIVDGHLPIIWEHRFKDNLGFDIGSGLLLPYNFFKILGKGSLDAYPDFFPFIINPNFKNDKFGISFYAAPKFYFRSIKNDLLDDHIDCISTYYTMKSYSDLFINEVGITYTYILNYSAVTFQPLFGISYINQAPHNDIANVKYRGTQSLNVSEHGLPYVNSIRIFMRFNIGWLM